MRRRDFILLLGSAGSSWPFAARAQRVRNRLGILSINSPEDDAPTLAVFREALQRLGHVEGRTIDIDYRASSGDTQSLTGLAQELIRLEAASDAGEFGHPDQGHQSHRTGLADCLSAVQRQLHSKPCNEASPCPGGRVTGVASDVEALIGKLAELVFDVMPDATRIGFLSNPAGGSTVRFEQQVKTAAKTRGVEVRIARAEKSDEIPGALRQLVNDKVQAASFRPMDF